MPNPLEEFRAMFTYHPDRNLWFGENPPCTRQVVVANTVAAHRPHSRNPCTVCYMLIDAATCEYRLRGSTWRYQPHRYGLLGHLWGRANGYTDRDLNPYPMGGGPPAALADLDLSVFRELTRSLDGYASDFENEFDYVRLASRSADTAAEVVLDAVAWTDTDSPFPATVAERIDLFVRRAAVAFGRIVVDSLDAEGGLRHAG